MLYSLLFIVKPVIFAPESLIAVTMLSGKPLYVNLTVTVSADSIAASVSAGVLMYGIFNARNPL